MRELQTSKKQRSFINCLHCSKPLSKRRITQHQKKCKDAYIQVPKGFKAQKVSNKGRILYQCPCGYQSRRYRILKHVKKCQIDKQAFKSTTAISQFDEYRDKGTLQLLSPLQIAPVIVEPDQSTVFKEDETQKKFVFQRSFSNPENVITLASKRAFKHVLEIQFESESPDYNQRLTNYKKNSSDEPQIANIEQSNSFDPLFDEQVYPKFSQFKQARQDAPLSDISTRYRIFTISLLLRFTGYFQHDLKIWLGSRCTIISTERFLTQLNSHTYIFKTQKRTLAQVAEDLQDIAAVKEDFITIINQQLLIHKLKEALENYQYAAMWYRAHTAPLIERQRKRAPRAHWQTLKMRRYIANVKSRNKKWGVKLRPMTVLKMRQRKLYCQQIDQMYLMKYHLSRPLPKNHRRKYFAKKEKLMVNYAIHRIADAFTADFYVDFLMYQMKDGSDDKSSNVKIFQSKKQFQKWQQSLPKQLPTTCIWLAVSRFYLQKRKSIMSAIYYSCQRRFKTEMPKKNKEEIYELVVKWYQKNNMIDKDDHYELKQYWTNPDYQKNIQNQAEKIRNEPNPFPQLPKLDEKMPEQPPQQEIKVLVQLPKPSAREFLPESNLSLFSQQQILQNRLQLKNKDKKIDSTDFQSCSRLKCKKWLYGNLFDCSVCHASYHNECWPKNNFCEVCQLMNDSQGFSRFSNLFLSQKYLIFSQLSPILTSPPQPLLAEGQKFAIKQIEQNFSKQAYCVTNYFHQSFIIYPFYNPQLKRLHPKDQQIIKSYDNQQLAFPVVVKTINEIKGKGLVARRPISKGQLVATYSGNVMSVAQVAKYGQSVKQYIFHLISGPNVLTNFVICPKDYASAGFFMNHTQKNSKKINTKTSICLTESGPIILMQATKNIKYGEQLLYNYNGLYESYDTKSFA